MAKLFCNQHLHTYNDLIKMLENKECSSEELAQASLARIKQYDTTLNSMITVTEELAIEQARAADSLRASGKANALTGIPLAQKYSFCTDGVKTSC